MFHTVQQRLVRLKLVFNNAGMSLRFAQSDVLSSSNRRRMVDIHHNSAFCCASNAMQLMQAPTLHTADASSTTTAQFRPGCPALSR